jgi:HAMP domain-containing protein
MQRLSIARSLRLAQADARRQARADSRRAILLVVAAGILALAGALALITAVVGAMRRPLDDLVHATHSLAEGKLEERVEPSGPRELQDLAGAFNAMGDDLATAQRRIDEERRRLAVTIESLGDALIVTEPGSSTIATVNPRAAQLVPELRVGERVDGENSPLPDLEAPLAKETRIEHHGRSLAVTAARLGAASHGVVWTVRDMSEWARLERAKSEFVATASHELRSPLTSIKGFVELLDHSSDGMTDRQREFIRSDPELASTPIVFVSVFSGRQELAGEWVVPKPIDAEELRDVLGAAVSAGRSRVLVVGREELQPTLEPALDDMGIEFQWEVTGAAAARVCRERRFEVALVDVGIRNPQMAIQALDLRGRRVRRAVILITDGEAPTPAGVGKLGMEVVPAEYAVSAVLAALRGER